MHNPFSRIVFDADAHAYSLDGKALASVSSVVARLKPPFDRDAVATRTARKTGRTVEEVLAEWEAKRVAGLARGTAVHEYIQRALSGQEQPVTPDDPFLALNAPAAERLREMDAFDAYWRQATTPDGTARVVSRVASAEWVVGDAQLGIAGTCDVVVYDNRTALHHILDWKTGKFEIKNPWQNLLAPFSDLPDCHLATYGLQVGLYRLLIERNTDLTLGDSYLVHLRDDGQFHVHKALDLRERLLAWLLPAPPAPPAITNLSDDALEVVA